MMVHIERIDGENIMTERDFTDIGGSGEIAHFIAELEVVKLDLLDIWEEYQKREK